MVITLHRPWNALAYSTGTSIPGEPCDYAFDTLVGSTNSSLVTGTRGVPGNLVDLGKKAGGAIMLAGTNNSFNDISGANYPIWRLRIVSGSTARYVRFDTGTTSRDREQRPLPEHHERDGQASARRGLHHLFFHGHDHSADGDVRHRSGHRNGFPQCLRDHDLRHAGLGNIVRGDHLPGTAFRPESGIDAGRDGSSNDRDGKRCLDVGNG